MNKAEYQVIKDSLKEIGKLLYFSNLEERLMGKVVYVMAQDVSNIHHAVIAKTIKITTEKLLDWTRWHQKCLMRRNKILKT